MAHTPGPWNWFKRSDGDVYLATPNRGHLIVMDFVRRGMQRGQARFAIWEGEERGNMGGVMKPTESIDVTKHPDAMLIAAAPTLLAACKAIKEHLLTTFPPYPDGQSPYDKVRAAIAMAEPVAVQPIAVTAVAPCGHPVRDSTCIGGPNDQNLWKCKTCGKEWLR